jgi:hypothetical protein
MLVSLIYVSRSLLNFPDEAAEVDRIVGVSVARNEGLSVTGALIFTGKRFAQVLEGPESSLDELMNSIRRDPRHTDLTVVQQTPVAERRFAGWSMAYSGASTYVNRQIAAQPSDSRRRAALAARITRMMEEFVGKLQVSG